MTDYRITEAREAYAAQNSSYMRDPENHVRFTDNDSAELVEVANSVVKIREQAKSRGAHYWEQQREVEQDTNLSEQGRQNQLTEIAARRRAGMQDLLAEENKVIDDAIRLLETRLDGFVGFSSDSMIAFRDAHARADALESQDEALPVLERSLRSNDRTMASAIFRCAREKGWPQILERFRTEKPSEAQAVNDIEKLRKLRADFGRGFLYS